jgi:hypothetical protein
MTESDLIVFSGPTLAPGRVAELFPGARCLGPVKRGDILAALRHQPRIICILDGLFGATLPVWHKEILWALQRGIRVFGAASMGALRAAELAAFGMVGVGRVYAAYHSEELEDEDEVTVAHAGPERDYRATSEALVDMRATLAAAQAAGVIDAAVCERLVEIARDIFYPERSYPSLLLAAERAGIAPEVRARLTSFLAVDAHLVKLKQHDALECLSRIRAELASPPASAGHSAATFEFSYTDAFDAFLSEELPARDATGASATEPTAVPEEQLVEELQLLGPDVFEPLLRQATARALRVALAPAERERPETTLDLEAIREASTHGLDGVARMLEELELSVDGYRRWMTEEASLADREDAARALLLAQFGPLLRALGDYPRVAQRARHKLRLCGPVAAPIAIANTARLWSEYFGGILNLDVPDDLDAYATRVGFEHQAQLLAAVARELEFRRLG